MTKSERLQYEAFRVIRGNINTFDNEDKTNDEIAGFVKGVLSLERELYIHIEREEREEKLKNKQNISS